MSTSETELGSAFAEAVRVTEDALAVDLVDGRSISVPLSWFPRLAHGTPKERAHWRFVGQGEGIHWPDLDEDISVRSLLVGRSSDETQASLEKWLAGRAARPV
jgi:hypothetical protein